MYDLIQATLTATIQVVAIAGFTGIVAHAMWKHHCSWMATYCPPVAPFTPDTQAEVEEIAPVEPALDPQPEPQSQDLPEPEDEDIWETPITSSSARYWMRQPQQPTKPQKMLLPQALEEPLAAPKKTVKPTFEGYSPARLKKIAKAMKIKRYSVMSQEELMVSISKHPAAAKYLTA